MKIGSTTKPSTVLSKHLTNPQRLLQMVSCALSATHYLFYETIGCHSTGFLSWLVGNPAGGARGFSSVVGAMVWCDWIHGGFDWIPWPKRTTGSLIPPSLGMIQSVCGSFKCDHCFVSSRLILGSRPDGNPVNIFHRGNCHCHARRFLARFVRVRLSLETVCVNLQQHQVSEVLERLQRVVRRMYLPSLSTVADEG